MVNTSFHHLSVSGICILLSMFQMIHAQWKLVNGLSGGHIMDIAQTSDGTVFAATNSDGIFKSTDQGVSWTPTDSILDMGDVSALTIVSDRITVYTLHDGKFYSTDKGTHWAAVSSQGSDNQTFSVVQGDDGEIISQGYMVSSRSINGGATWSDVEELPNMGGAPMVIGRNGVLICGSTSNRSGIVRSNDHGVTWSSPDTTVGRVSSIGKKTSGDLLAQSSKGVFLSTDDGSTWTLINNDYPYISFTDMRTGPSGNLFTFSNKGVYRSADEGKSWVTIIRGLANTSIMCIDISNTGIVYAGSYGGGIFTSSDNGATWITPISGLPITPVYTLTVNQTGALFAGTFKSGIFTLFENETYFKRSTNGLPVNISVTSIMSGGSDEIIATTDSGLFRSTNNGENWSSMSSNLPGGKDVNKLGISGTGSIVVETDSGIFFSADHGATWVVPNHGQDFPEIISFANDVDSNIYAGTTTGVLRSDNGGMKWVSASDGLPRNALIISVGVTSRHSVLAGTNDAGIYRSIDRGVHWLPTGKDLLDSQRVNIIIADSNGNSFAGLNNGGIIHSTDDGISWKRIDTGFPNTAIISLAISNNRLFAGANGKGIWSRDLSEITEIRNDRKPLKIYPNVELTIVSTPHKGSPLMISFTLAQTQLVESSLYNLSGCKIASLANGSFLQGEHRVVFNPISYANGNYIVRTKIGTVTSKKVITIFR